VTFKERQELFCENLRLFNKTLLWLKKSLERMSTVNVNGTLSERELEAVEALLSRYSRSVDILINRVLRSLDYLELEDSKRKLDVVIRAEKRGFVDDYNKLIEMKDLRNELAHEYLEERLMDKVKEVVDKSWELLKIAERINAYSKEMKYCF